MKKILLAIDGPQFSAGAMNTLLFLSSKMKISVTGAFLENIFKFKIDRILHKSDKVESEVEREYDSSMDITLHNFEIFCAGKGIPAAIHEISEGYDQDVLLTETRFADLMAISSERFFHFDEEIELNPFVVKLLKHTECPVLVIPESFQGIESVILTFDNTTSSIYAIKMFSYLFPDLVGLPTTLIAGMHADKGDETQKALELMTDFCKSHFTDFKVVQLPELSPTQLESYAENQSKAVIVSGSFGRNDVSMMWKGSFSEHIIAQHKVPVFIAHR